MVIRNKNSIHLLFFRLFSFVLISGMSFIMLLIEVLNSLNIPSPGEKWSVNVPLSAPPADHICYTDSGLFYIQVKAKTFIFYFDSNAVTCPRDVYFDCNRKGMLQDIS